MNDFISSWFMLIVCCLDSVDNYRWEISSCGPGSVPTTGFQASCLLSCSLADVQPCLLTTFMSSGISTELSKPNHMQSLEHVVLPASSSDCLGSLSLQHLQPVLPSQQLNGLLHHHLPGVLCGEGSQGPHQAQLCVWS